MSENPNSRMGARALIFYKQITEKMTFRDIARRKHESIEVFDQALTMVEHYEADVRARWEARCLARSVPSAGPSRKGARL